MTEKESGRISYLAMGRICIRIFHLLEEMGERISYLAAGGVCG